MKRLHLSALIFGDDPERIRNVKALLEHYCDDLESTPPASIFSHLPKHSQYHVIVVAGLTGDPRPSDFFKHLKKQYPGARTIYISDTIDAGVEVEARAAGTLFVGSLDAFAANVTQIIQSVWKKQVTPNWITKPDNKEKTEPERKVVVVDDDPCILHSITRCLMNAPYSIYTFDHPQKALKVIDDLKPMVVIADYRLPDMSGVDLLEKIKHRLPTTIRMLMTGKTDIETVLIAINRCQVYKFIPKPWNADQLQTDIAEAVAFSHLLEGRQISKPVAEHLLQQRTERMAGVRELATAVCHEMGQPLQVISGWTEYLLMDKSSIGQEMVNQLSIIRDQVNRMSMVLTNLRQLQSYRTASYPGGGMMIDITEAAASKLS